jgi:hypothetical protein
MYRGLSPVDDRVRSPPARRSTRPQEPRSDAPGGRISGRAAKSRKKAHVRFLSAVHVTSGPCRPYCGSERARASFATARLKRDLVPADFRPAIPGAFFPVRVLSVFSVELGDARGTRARPKPLNLLTRASHAAPRWVGFLAFDSHPLPPFTPREFTRGLRRLATALTGFAKA